MSAVDGAVPPGTTLRHLEVPGGTLAVHDATPAGVPRGTALLVPGFSGSKEDFGPVLPLLAERGWRVVAVDQRGQHQSPGSDDPGAYTPSALGADLRHLLDVLEIATVHLVGHSFGGLVARQAVLQDPARFASLVLLDSGPAALLGPRTESFAFLRPILEDGGLPALWEVSQSLPVDPAKPVVTPETRAFLRTRFLAHSPTAMLAMAESLTTEPDRVEDLRAAGVPVVVVYGERDDAWSPAEQDAMAERLGAPVVVIPDAWHSPAAENPALTAQVLSDLWAALAEAPQ